MEKLALSSTALSTYRTFAKTTVVYEIESWHPSRCGNREIKKKTRRIAFGTYLINEEIKKSILVFCVKFPQRGNFLDNAVNDILRFLSFFNHRCGKNITKWIANFLVRSILTTTDAQLKDLQCRISKMQNAENRWYV